MLAAWTLWAGQAREGALATFSRHLSSASVMYSSLRGLALLLKLGSKVWLGFGWNLQEFNEVAAATQQQKQEQARE